ncbi:MAG: 50S ribosomal protein L10 [Candidatus Levybacteria bacterium RIFCSPLOWO2_01_FULL_39_10]|nr:MAG: 50S ribosomal protein L10 [Candidatus Levybacteria bacterium RIFCSPLOWO2_01_FULL_39_10]
MPKIKQPTKKSGRARKEQIVAELTDKLDKSNALVFADYQGLTHPQLEGLKKELKKLDSEVSIAKNTLLKFALERSKNYADLKDNQGLNFPTAIFFIKGNMVMPLKVIQKAIKNFGLPKIKFGILEGNLTDEEGVLRIADLPTREVLLAQLVGTLNFPIQGFITGLNANIQKFVMILKAVEKTKSNLTVEDGT